MSRQPRKISKGASRSRHISVRAVRRDPPDLRKLSRALIALAMAQAAAEQEAQAQVEAADGATVDVRPANVDQERPGDVAAADDVQESDHD